MLKWWHCLPLLGWLWTALTIDYYYDRLAVVWYLNFYGKVHNVRSSKPSNTYVTYFGKFMNCKYVTLIWFVLWCPLWLCEQKGEALHKSFTYVLSPVCVFLKDFINICLTGGLHTYFLLNRVFFKDFINICLTGGLHTYFLLKTVNIILKVLINYDRFGKK